MSLQRNIRLLMWFNFFTDFRLYAPIAIIYFSRVSHSYALGASIFSITYITSALLDVPSGLLADSIGRKKIVVLGAVFSALALICYAVGLGYWILALGALFDGLSRSFYSGNNDALLHNLLSEEGLAHEFHTYSGKLNSRFQVALATSGLLGALIATWSFPLVMWFSVGPQLICLFISFQITDTKRVVIPNKHLINDLQEAIQGFIKNPHLRLVSLTSIISYAAGETVYQFQAVFYNIFLPLWAVGFVKTLSNIFAATGFYFSGKVINKFNAIKVLFVGSIYGKSIGIFALLFPTIASPFLMASTSFFFGLDTTASVSLMQKNFTEKQRATMSSLNSFAGSLAFGVLTFVVGLFADKIGPAKALLLVQIIGIPTLWFTWKLFKLRKN